MDSPRYPIMPDQQYLSFTFFSEGPRGRILKIIRFKLLQVRRLVMYNLGLGDVESQDKDVVWDDVVSDNGDRDKILMTVVECIRIFFQHRPDSYVFAFGRSPARTRLFQMMISNRLTEIPVHFKVYGLTGTGWEEFCKGRNYNGFMIHNQKSSNFNK